MLGIIHFTLGITQTMDFHSWLIYLSVVTAIIVTPGPSAALCLTHGVSHGPARALATVVGGMVASSALMSLSALGLGAVVAASSTLFLVIKAIGALYLVVLGISIWRSKPSELEEQQTGEPSHRSTIAKLFGQGFVVGIANPKDLLFFGALFPQFINPSAPLAQQLATLGATWLVVDGTAMFSYAAFGSKLAPRIRTLGKRKLLNRVTGGFFIAAGGLLAAARK
jgi:homoserine/homoserine lactone efflux protein